MTAAAKTKSARKTETAAPLAIVQAPSIKLHDAHRRAMLEDMIGHRFRAEVESHFPAWAALAQRVYERVYDDAARRKMKALPEEWLPESDKIGARFGGTVTNLMFNGSMANCHRVLVQGVTEPASVSRRVASKHHDESSYRTCIALACEATDELSVAHDKLLAAHQDLEQRIKTARQEVHAALAQFGSTRQMLEAWPEAAPFLPGGAPKQAIAVRRADLNALLGLNAEQVPA